MIGYPPVGASQSRILPAEKWLGGILTSAPCKRLPHNTDSSRDSFVNWAEPYTPHGGTFDYPD